VSSANDGVVIKADTNIKVVNFIIIVFKELNFCMTALETIGV
jgi:hypothetical protein